ncbi:MAG: TetR/AcrR family transcriptional regulator [Dysgonamonadaceae bacterium]|jgi:AcrR family transcriptional regulator|nr:TetR/AcrR family transcriptional regulator [Dysgonamonadaceae bacterium]
MSEVVVKTKDRLIEVARQLFARIGVDNTTMNDIALASEKGRRTLYTYFKSKTEIYNAVVQSELKILYDSLEAVAKKSLPADEKMVEYIHIRLESTGKLVYRNGTLRAYFFRDLRRVESARKAYDERDFKVILSILHEGIEQDIFEISDPVRTALILQSVMKGMEIPYIRGIINGFSPSDSSQANSVINVLFNGIKKHPPAL